jgi:hypothetical protein
MHISINVIQCILNIRKSRLFRLLRCLFAKWNTMRCSRVIDVEKPRYLGSFVCARWVNPLGCRYPRRFRPAQLQRFLGICQCFGTAILDLLQAQLGISIAECSGF